MLREHVCVTRINAGVNEFAEVQNLARQSPADARGASSVGVSVGKGEAGRWPLAGLELTLSKMSLDRWVFLSAVHLEIRP